MVETWLAKAGGRRLVIKRWTRQRVRGWPLPPDPGVLARTNHPRLQHFIGAGKDDEGVWCHVFTWIPGTDLKTLLARPTAPGPDPAVLIADCAQALSWLHARCSVAPRLHGDVCPGNVVVGPTGRCRLVDRMALVPGTHPAGEGIVYATLPYAAPEVLAGEAPTEASDVWSLAVTAGAALRAWPPPDLPGPSTPASMLEAIRTHPPAEALGRAGMHTALREMLSRMASPDPGLRPEAAAVHQAARDAAGSTGSSP